MDFFDVVNNRQSVRAYQPKAIEEHKLQSVLDAVAQAPTAGGLQAFQIYLVREPEFKQALAKSALDQAFIAHAPLVLVFCAHKARSGAHYEARGEMLYSVQDATIAAAYAQLAATAVGLATCWIGAFSEEQVSQILGVPPEQRPVALLPIGYAAELPRRTLRRPVSELVLER